MAKDLAPPTSWREFELRSGEQAVINGAMMCAVSDACLRVGSGASLLTAATLWHSRRHDGLASSLYYATLAAADAGRLDPETRHRLLDLLGTVVSRLRTHAAQVECARYAAAIGAFDAPAALDAARRLATMDSAGRQPAPRLSQAPVGSHT
ncbi:flagellar biosynthesis repressor FlbT [Erythrobacter sp. HKB08]|uniref:flagellar biosynthesis repressor FlbT n=1 Tax=Erythrobacter sp. HKB08 TaxID=2502843 RepID=UPI001008E7F7|nr:flagellar biosynthesis repressor FlbT [Erythrobacter sp. HKB08]